MSNFRYIRMARNDQGWKRPHGGRMGGSKDFVGEEGFGPEDWNFAKDVWKDDRYHLYFKPTPKDFNQSEFNFVLGVHVDAFPVPLIVGFVENATYGVSKLPKKVLQRRAREMFALKKGHNLGPKLRDLSEEKIAKYLKKAAREYKFSVAPHDLHILAQPVPMPHGIFKVPNGMFRPFPMTARQYGSLKKEVLSDDINAYVDQEEEASFPEGLLVETWHRSRERNRRVVKLAKKQFIDRHGWLFCEACTLNPEKHFGSTEMRNRIIEAHHDVALSDDGHKGKTKPSDLRMVCPTCHRAIHTFRPWKTVDELRKCLNSER